MNPTSHHRKARLCIDGDAILLNTVVRKLSRRDRDNIVDFDLESQVSKYSTARIERWW